MIPSQILQKVKRIEIRTRGLVNDLFGGEYHSVFKGRGMTFSEVREYQPGDDIRLIDWNVTARTGSPFIKVFEEERELTVYLLVDISASGNFGSGQQLKREVGAEIAAVLGFSAIKNNDKVGLILFSDEIEKFVVPKKGKSHVLRVVRELLYTEPKRSGTSLKIALDYLLKVAKRKSVVFIISDFIDQDYLKSLKVVNRKHDVIGIQLFDPAETDIPNMGLAKVEDPETGESFWVDTSSKDLRNRLKKDIQTKQEKFLKDTRKIRFDIISIATNQDFVEPLMSFFKMREKRS
ncbi:MAG: DUF58 domain-containing protein [Candidatus Marinimicrobia bacterium]|nr:DUF58 domain-containing protein [Candidatus Neomarinimicrobiota bacterium]MBT3501111.1 DUF58 domain-containing protein [Candidatus Neomarinimicrobiota bacterium]MBT3840507.1 DUF58 domain-containing protein [Candidatus Neomarinimicrobiota bacterium]MBT3999358.1 DUF58 domain-containing protein [Candidatus Neomarinimicrobiota bacterium]MBT4578443.1 DUF58 domain-containing protein [Candidatus Neomarinimicrobiota bacterium]